MSSFFRSAADVSEGDDTSTSGYEESSSDHTRHAVSRAPSDVNLNTFQQNVLFATLLEEKCLNDVCEELNNNDSETTFTKDDPSVKALAAERYQAMSAQLRSHGLAPAGFEHDSLLQVRQRARDGLSILSQNLNAMRLGQTQTEHARSNTQSLVKSAPMSRVVSQRNVTQFAGLDNAVNSLALSALSPPRQNMPHPLVSSHPLIDSTRYVRDFEEVSMLGKGGYGTVHKCNHRLDGYSYAVKKIPLASTVLYRVQKKGPTELNAILTELRTMAGMDHPNIVRYYGGWIEWSTRESERPRTARQQSLLVGPDTVAGAIDDDNGILFEDSSIGPSDISDVTSSDTHSFGNQDSSAKLQLPEEEDEVEGILFEHSNPARSESSDRTLSDTHSFSNPNLGAELQPVLSRGTVASVSDEDVEYVTRNDTTTHSASIEDETDDATGSGHPSLTLHIQMSLYPLTLSDYLRAAPTQDQGLPSQHFNHCFHLPSAARILLAILSGVSYLHSQSIVHRDLKPANIFLHPQVLAPHHHRPSGSIDPFACTHCPPRSPSSSSRQCSMKVCIGDFGLVSTIHAGPPTSPAKAVGTELYRPVAAYHHSGTKAVVNHVDPALDVFSLGIIFCELLYQFETRMERHDKLSRLRQNGEFPEDFCQRVGEKGDEVKALVRAMLGFEDLKREQDEDMVCLVVRRRIADLLDDGSA